MIIAENVTRKYGDVVAVDDVSFSIAQGEIVGLLGHNGAGKTTIMKMLTGDLEPTAGKITINGLELQSHRQQVQRDIGYLPENCPVYPEMTVLDYLDYSASLHGVSAAERREMVIEAVARTELTEKAHRNIATLSRGYRQRTGVAQAILHNPRILILDEPTNGLDPTQIQQMRTLIRELAVHSTVIISTHILQEVQATCDRVIIVRNGQKALDTRLDKLQAQNRLLLTLAGKVDHDVDDLAVIAGVDKIELLEEAQGRPAKTTYGLRLEEGSSPEETAAAVAARVYERGWPLYSLFPETRDLESVFAQISAQ